MKPTYSALAWLMLILVTAAGLWLVSDRLASIERHLREYRVPDESVTARSADARPLIPLPDGIDSVASHQMREGFEAVLREIATIGSRVSELEVAIQQVREASDPYSELTLDGALGMCESDLAVRHLGYSMRYMVERYGSPSVLNETNPAGPTWIYQNRAGVLYIKFTPNGIAAAVRAEHP